MNNLISTKDRVIKFLVGPSGTKKSQLSYNWLKIEFFQPKVDKIDFSNQHSQSLYDVMQKEVQNFDFVQGVHFEFSDSLKNNGAKNFLVFDD